MILDIILSVLATSTLINAQYGIQPDGYYNGSTTCGILGYDLSNSYFYSIDPSLTIFSGCQEACLEDSNCTSFSVGYADPQCNHYHKPLVQNVNPVLVYGQFVF